MTGMMLILLCLVLLIIIVLLFVAAVAPDKSRSSRLNTGISRTPVSTPRIEDSQDESLFHPRRPNALEQRGPVSTDMFLPTGPRGDVRPTQQGTLGSRPGHRVNSFANLFGNGHKYERVEVTPPTRPTSSTSPLFKGGESAINWDARCRLFGDTLRVCSCADCKALRKTHGV